MTTRLLKGIAIASLAVLLSMAAVAQGTVGCDVLLLALAAGGSRAFESELSPPPDARWKTVRMDGETIPLREGVSPLAPAALVSLMTRQLAGRGYVPLRWVPRGDPRVAPHLLRRGAYVELLGASMASLGYMDPRGRTAAAVAWPGPGGVGSRYVIGGLVEWDAAVCDGQGLDTTLDSLESGGPHLKELLLGR
ncbi:MAG: hypothetical protein HY722_08565 [Planctomycetes bacterium]|nr:hypothetical protein [Planctomycetota bacterium]